ncbi:MAG: acetoin utilization protein AcuC [Gammaproteobacteria bacterium]|nr:acetoin utilization protein AcuC [Gammaproteobacteria bacterium]
MSRIGFSRRAFLRRTALAALGLLAPALRAAAEAGVYVYADDALAQYGFAADHPFGTDRQAAFLARAATEALVPPLRGSRVARRAELLHFHTAPYVDRVAGAEGAGLTALDGGDTPVVPGLYAHAATVAGTALAGLEAILAGACTRTFQPIGGLHHAGRDHAAGFCVFNDPGIVIEALRKVHGIERIAYVDIDAHHGDGVFYAFEEDPQIVIADVHQDHRTLFPGTGRAEETGLGAARGTKLNVELPPWSGDAAFFAAWPRVLAHVERFEPEFVLLQAGADGLKGDPIAQLDYTPAVHARVARDLTALADRHAHGRLMAFGGGGYDRDNLARAWCAVVRALRG